MNILFAGTPEPSAKLLQSLCKNERMNIIGVITKPDVAQKRGNKIKQSHVSLAAFEANLPIFKPDDLNSAEFKETLLKLDFDFLVVAAYGNILPNWMLASPKMMPINVHYSLLPKYRGLLSELLEILAEVSACCPHLAEGAFQSVVAFLFCCS